MKTNVRFTSLLAYEGEVKPKLGQKQQEILDLFYTYPEENFTNSEIGLSLNWSINRITPRVYELRKLKKLCEDERRKCEVTGRWVNAWKLNNKLNT